MAPAPAGPGCRGASAVPSCSSSALEVFVAQGYHAAAMDDIAERAGVSKPVLYQHFPGKLDLYLALLDSSCDTIIDNCRVALEATQDNKQRVAATMDAFFEYVAGDTGAFRLVFESDLTNEPAVRGHVDRVTTECAAMIAHVIHDDTGLPDAASRLLAVSLVGMAQVSARFWLSEARRDRQGRCGGPGGRSRLARHPRATRSPTSTDRTAPLLTANQPYHVKEDLWRSRSASSTPPVSFVVETDETSENLEKMVTEAVASDGVLAITDTKGRKVLVPAARLAYVEIGGGVSGQVGFRH